MQLMQPFNPSQFDPTQGGTGGFPIGKHKVIVIKSEVKPTKDGASGLIEYEGKIVEGEFAGTIGSFRFNLYSTSQQAVEIAHKQYSAFCHSIGLGNVVITNTEQTHNIPFIIDVAMQKGEEAAKKGYTEVKKFYDANGNEPNQYGAGQQQQNNSGFGNQGQQQNNGQQNNNGGFGQQGNNSPVTNNVAMDNGNSNGGFGNQGQQGQQQNNNGGNGGNNGGGGSTWSQNVGTNGNQGNTGGNGNGNGGNTSNGGTPAAGGWGQQRS